MKVERSTSRFRLRASECGTVPSKRTYASLLAWISKHHKGDAADKPMLSHAPAQQTAAQRAEAIIQARALLDMLAKGLARITGLGGAPDRRRL